MDAVDSLHASVAASLCSATEQCCVKMTQCCVEITANITEDSQWLCPVAGVSSRCAAAALLRSLSSQQGAPQATGRQPSQHCTACTALLCSVQVDRARAETRDGPDCYFPFMEAIRIRISSDLWPMFDDPRLFTLHLHTLDFIHSCQGLKVKSCLFPSTSRNASAYNQRD